MDDIPEPEDTGGGGGVSGDDPVIAYAVDAFRKLSTWEQTVLAAQQLGIIVGAAMLVGGGSCSWWGSSCPPSGSWRSAQNCSGNKHGRNKE